MSNTALIIISFIIPCALTSLGASLVFLFKKGLSEKVSVIFTGFAAGVMMSAAIFGLLIPAMEREVSYLNSGVVACLGFLLGVLLIFAIDKLVPHIHVKQSESEEEGIITKNASKVQKMFFAILIHNIPEGLSVGVAIGAALACQNVNASLLSALALSIGIGIQNFPEGAIVSLPFKSFGLSNAKSFGLGTISGIIEPLAAGIGLVLSFYIEALMPWCLAFSAGCMVYVVIEDLVPTSSASKHSHFGVFSFVAGFLLMVLLETVL